MARKRISFRDPVGLIPMASALLFVQTLHMLEHNRYQNGC